MMIYLYADIVLFYTIYILIIIVCIILIINYVKNDEKKQ